jgi:hypothetical protein
MIKLTISNAQYLQLLKVTRAKKLSAVRDADGATALECQELLDTLMDEMSYEPYGNTTSFRVSVDLPKDCYALQIVHYCLWYANYLLYNGGAQAYEVAILIAILEAFGVPELADIVVLSMK